MHGTPLGDLEELRALFVAQWTVELDTQLDPVDLGIFALTFGAIFGVNARMSETGGNASEGHPFSLGIHGEGHRRACPE